MVDRDWIIVHDATKGEMAYAMECLRCGSIARVVVPMNMSLWLATAKQFQKNHAGCIVEVRTQTETDTE